MQNLQLILSYGMDWRIAQGVVCSGMVRGGDKDKRGKRPQENDETGPPRVRGVATVYATHWR